MKRFLVLVSLLLVVSASSLFVGAKAASANPLFAQSRLVPVNGSGVRGFALLVQQRSGGTFIFVLATGLQPGHQYRSLYYSAEDNITCQIEPYSGSDIVGMTSYTGNSAGFAHVSGRVGDKVSDIYSVSVRDASQPFTPQTPGTLLACAAFPH